MKKNILILFIFIIISSIYAENKKYNELKNIIKSQREQREIYYKIKNDWNKEKQKILNQLNLLKKEKTHLLLILENAENQQNVLSENIIKLKQELKLIKNNNAIYLPILTKMLKELELNIKNNLHFKLSFRLNQIEQVKNYLYDKNRSISDKFNKLIEIYSTELKYCNSNEIYETKIDSKIVNVLRIGKLVLYYKTLNGKEYAIIDKNNKWKKINSEKTIKEIDKAFKIINKTGKLDLLNLIF